MNKKSKAIVRILLIAITAIILIFGIYSLVWLIRYNVMYKPFLNDNFVSQDNDGMYIPSKDSSLHSEFPGKGIKHYFGLTFPEYPEWGNDITSNLAIKTTLKDKNGKELSICFSFKKEMFKETRYNWEIIDESDTDRKVGESVEICTDSNLQCIYENSNNGCKLNYDYCKDAMCEFYNKYLVSVFGEKLFPKI